MTTLIANKDVRTIAAGINISRAAAVPATVAQSPQSIFTVSGGRILVVYLTAHVTTVMSATAYTLSIGLTPTEGAGTSVPAALAATSASLANLEVGTNLNLGATAGAAVQVGTNASTVQLIPGRVLVNPGVITLTGSATQTGQLKWDLCYIPLDSGAQVVSN